MRLYTRDYRHVTPEELKEHEGIMGREDTGLKLVRKKLYREYSEAMRHHLSLFPNNHIELFDWNQRDDYDNLIDEFEKLVHKEGVLEQEILNYINHTPAYHIVGSLFLAAGFTFGHHDAYVFPEFKLGSYRADYLLIGSRSGGYEFVFVELEKSQGYVTLKDGHPGLAIRKGCFQIEDWLEWLEGNFNDFSSSLQAEKGFKELPKEFLTYDSTRIHGVVVAGLRSDYIDKTYRDRRAMQKEKAVHILHYDNLCDATRLLKSRNTF